MKNLPKLLFAAATIAAPGAACEKGDDDSPNGIPPVKADAALTTFFDENLWEVSSSIFREEGYAPHVDSCVMINSAAEFAQIDFILNPVLELPSIDFGKYTLLIGQYTVRGGVYNIVEQQPQYQDRGDRWWRRFDAP